MADELFTEFEQVKTKKMVRLTQENGVDVMRAVGGTVHFDHSGGTTFSVRSMRRAVGDWLDTSGEVHGDGDQPRGWSPQHDEHHTLEELYEFRMLYNAHAARGWLGAGRDVVKSWRHSDGEECFGGGWFIVVADIPISTTTFDTAQVSNHYPAAAWDLFQVPDVDRAPEWDGHTPQDAARRLRAGFLLPEEA